MKIKSWTKTSPRKKTPTHLISINRKSLHLITSIDLLLNDIKKTKKTARTLTSTLFNLTITLYIPISTLQADVDKQTMQCSSNCIQVENFQSQQSPLSFSRFKGYLGETKNQWRHNYSHRLVHDGENIVLFDQQGNKNTFARLENMAFTQVGETQGSLVLIDEQYQWTDNEGVQYRFFGSYPVTVSYPSGQSLQLRYHNNRLQSVSDDLGQSIQFSRKDAEHEEIVSFPNGESVSYRHSPCPPGDVVSQDDSTPGCATDANPVTGFYTQAARPGVSLLDARPSSCQSYFVEYYGTSRGEEIESGFINLSPYSHMTATTHSFPIVDFISDNELIMLRSRDLASPSFNNPNTPEALYRRLMRDGAQAQSRFLDPLQTNGFVSLTEQGQTTHITHNPAQQLSLHLVIRHGIASPEHWRQIEQARAALQAQYGIHLEVVIIP